VREFVQRLDNEMTRHRPLQVGREVIEVAPGSVPLAGGYDVEPSEMHGRGHNGGC
jgi:hypothetical protein